MNEQELLDQEEKEFQEYNNYLGDYIYLQDENGEWKKTNIGWCG